MALRQQEDFTENIHLLKISAGKPFKDGATPKKKTGVVYDITCDSNGDYIGETGRILDKRLNENWEQPTSDPNLSKETK